LNLILLQGVSTYGLDVVTTVLVGCLVLTVLNTWFLMIRRSSPGTSVLVGFSTVIAIVALGNLLLPRVTITPIGTVVIPTNITTAVVTVVNETTTTTTTTYSVDLTTTLFSESGLTPTYFSIVTLFLIVNAFVVLLYMFTILFPRIVRRL